MTALAVLDTAQAPPPRHSVTGAVTLFGCGGCKEPVTQCTMHRGACVGNGYLHLRTRLHACGRWSGKASCAWPSMLAAAQDTAPLTAGDRVTYTGRTFRGQTGTIEASDGQRIFDVVLDSGDQIACTARQLQRTSPDAKAVRR